MKKIYLNTMGCQMNVYDSRRILDALEKLGYAETLNPEEADFLMINTCYIREKASDKVFSMLGKFAKIKADRKKQGLPLIKCIGGIRICRNSPCFMTLVPKKATVGSSR